MINKLILTILKRGTGLMRRLVMVVFAIFILLFPIKSYASDDVYRSATEYDYPPFSVTENGQADGFSVELLKAVADVMGLDITFKIDDLGDFKRRVEKR